MNTLDDNLVTGAVGELLVQLRLYQYDVQAAPPFKDSGNDLIAVNDNTFRAIQVKTTRIEEGRFDIPEDRQYHILAFVRLSGEENYYHLDDSDIFLIDKTNFDTGKFDFKNLEKFKINKKLVDELFDN